MRQSSPSVSRERSQYQIRDASDRPGGLGHAHAQPRVGERRGRDQARHVLAPRAGRAPGRTGARAAPRRRPRRRRSTACWIEGGRAPCAPRTPASSGRRRRTCSATHEQVHVRLGLARAVVDDQERAYFTSSPPSAPRSPGTRSAQARRSSGATRLRALARRSIGASRATRPDDDAHAALRADQVVAAGARDRQPGLAHRVDQPRALAAPRARRPWAGSGPSARAAG